MTWDQIGAAVGGLGLLLLGMGLLTDGLKLAAGRSLNRLLGRWTSTQLRGLGAGALITAVVQSSSAVTVAIIGFANAGLLTLSQSAWVVFGSNVGTTLTSWLIALVGLRIKVEAFALPLVGVGMLLRLGRPTARLGGIGIALAGFGTLFLGLDLLKDAFSGFGAALDVHVIEGWGVWGRVAGVGLGALVTTLMQSSSAAMAVILTASFQGLLSPPFAAALVIGANVGTTSTAIMATLGATPSARRVAVLHVIFNLLTAAVALALLVPLLDLIEFIRTALGATPGPATDLALFHTVFNLLGIALMWPLARSTVRWLEGRFRTAEEDIARSRYLDDNVLSVPELGARAVRLELERAGSLTLDLVRAVVDRTVTDSAQFSERARSRRRLMIAIAEHATRLNRASLSLEVADAVAGLQRAHQQLWTMVRVAGDLVLLRSETDDSVPVDLPALSPAFVDSVMGVLDAADVSRDDFELERCRMAREHFKAARNAERARVSAVEVDEDLPLVATAQLLQEIAHDRRLVNRAWKFAAAVHAVRLGATARKVDPGPALDGAAASGAASPS